MILFFAMSEGKNKIDELNGYDAVLFSMRDIDLRSLKKARCYSIITYIVIFVCSIVCVFVDLLNFYLFVCFFCSF